MAFRISTRPRVKERVSLIIEVDGEKLDNSFDATFQILPVSRTTEETMSTDEGQRAMLAEALVDLGDLVDEAGAPVPFTPELRDALADRIEVRVALLKAYQAAATRAAAGN